MKKVHFHPIGITFETIGILIKEHKTDAVALYMAYAEITHWQKNYSIKATTGFMIKRLQWTRPRFLRAKKVLISKQMIENLRVADIKTKKVKGWYIKVNYLVTSGADIQAGGFPIQVDSDTSSADNTNKVRSTEKKELYKNTKNDFFSKSSEEGSSAEDEYLVGIMRYALIAYQGINPLASTWIDGTQEYEEMKELLSLEENPWTVISLIGLVPELIQSGNEQKRFLPRVSTPDKFIRKYSEFRDHALSNDMIVRSGRRWSCKDKNGDIVDSFSAPGFSLSHKHDAEDFDEG